MNESLKRQLDKLVKHIEARSQAEKILVLGLLVASIVLAYLSLAYDPIRADIQSVRNQVNSTERQILAQQTTYAAMVEQSQEDPNRFANERLVVISREQVQLDEEIDGLAGDLVTPDQMTTILTTVLERQAGLELVYFQNKTATPLREGVTNTEALLAETGAVNFEDVIEDEVAGQIYEHGLTIEFQGDYFSTLKYLRFLEEITGSFFWDSISYRQLEWPRAHISLEIHTLSLDQGFIGV